MRQSEDTGIVDGAEAVLDYHRRTMHRRDGYARGPETLDWDAQPDPYRRYDGAPLLPLPLVSGRIEAPFAALTGEAAVKPAKPSLAALAALLELSFGLSAIKEYGPDRWTLRCNPSSGNLHPTEAYVLVSGIAGLAPGIYHYRADQHALELRRATSFRQPGLWIGLGSIQWREAWKYGERAFRYCQLDMGHALGALDAASALLGWRAALVDGVDSAEIGALLGADHPGGDVRAEAEEPEALVRIDMTGSGIGTDSAPFVTGHGDWQGAANLLDPHPMYHWPVIDAVAQASRGSARPMPLSGPARTRSAPEMPAVPVILKRRSAQRYDRDHVMPAPAFARLAASAGALLGGLDLGLILFVHRVEGLEPGLYALPGRPDREAALRAALNPDFSWAETPGLPSLRWLVKGDFRKLIRAFSCHQAIAADACVTLCMLGALGPAVEADPFQYRQLHWQAGLVGQRLYLEAEAAGENGTGIGCFLDDEIHELLGLSGGRFQALYHFALGRALPDERISAAPAYPGRTRDEVIIPS